MAINIFDKYGIKEVANVYFEALEDDPKSNVYKGDIVLFLDTLKVSTIETTAETTDATGGWGNPKLISWDYGKEITITLEDALISLESLRFMLGGAIHKPKSESSSGAGDGDQVIVRHTEEVIAGAGGAIPVPTDHITGLKYNGTDLPAVQATANHPVRFINYGGGTGSTTAGVRTQLVYDSEAASADYTLNGGEYLKFKNDAMGISTAAYAAEGDHIRIFWEEVVSGDANADTAVEVTISPDTFPGTYRVVGDTFMRSQKTGKDEAFQFVIGKAKVQSEVTITLEAEGDPSTFEMTLNVLRDDNERGEKEMMKLIRYGGVAADAAAAGDDKGSLAATGANAG